MSDTYFILLTSAITIGFIHTAIGIDHSLPFVVLGKTRGWSLLRTLAITSICGVAHVASSVVIAAIGLAIGVAGSKLEWVEATRGGWAAWVLVGFGLAYSAVALFKMKTSRFREHDHEGHHAHWRKLSESADMTAMPAKRLMPALLVIFALGPCEALLPLLTASGITLTLLQGIIVALVFSLSTIFAMLSLVALGYWGTSTMPWLERVLARAQPHTHVVAGVTLTLSGLSIQFLGL